MGFVGLQSFVRFGIQGRESASAGLSRSSSLCHPSSIDMSYIVLNAEYVFRRPIIASRNSSMIDSS